MTVQHSLMDSSAPRAPHSGNSNGDTPSSGPIDYNTYKYVVCDGCHQRLSNEHTPVEMPYCRHIFGKEYNDPGVIARESPRDGSYADLDPNQVVEWGRINAQERANESERRAHFKREMAREQPLFKNGVPTPITSSGQANKDGRSRPAPANARFDAVKFGFHERANRLEREDRITQRESAQPRGCSSSALPPLGESIESQRQKNKAAWRLVEARRLFNNEPKTKSPPPIHPPFPPPAATFIPGKSHNQTVEELRHSVGFQTSKDKYAPKGKKWSFSGTQSSNVVNGPLRLEVAPYNNPVTPFRGQAFLPNRTPSFSSDNHTQPSTSGSTPLRPEAVAFEMSRPSPREHSSLVDYATWPTYTDWAAVHKSFRADDIVVPASQLYRNPYSGALFNNSGQEVIPPPNKHPLPGNHPLNSLMTNNPETFHRGQLVKSRQVFPPPYNLPRGEVPSAIPEGEKGIELLQRATSSYSDRSISSSGPSSIRSRFIKYESCIIGVDGSDDGGGRGAGEEALLFEPVSGQRKRRNSDFADWD
ncbi:hypothetical protein AA0113_g11223 [Alternaria arborescens]|uniref:Uncharacterized protein n=1 Tax=Alternaria arborescens TaxID=156630 RepID=A0A4Q4QDQ2_9PLEO|nr:hypothetical protein AA0113_g11223 [Alternaria arborescens]